MPEQALPFEPFGKKQHDARFHLIGQGKMGRHKYDKGARPQLARLREKGEKKHASEEQRDSKASKSGSRE
jgi:hypothetical protein